MNSNVLFGIWPYVALVIGGGGLLLRYRMAMGRTPRAAEESDLAQSVFAGGRIWRGSMALLLLTHVLLIAVPKSILVWNSVPLRLYLLEGTGFLLGGLAIGGCADVMLRHLARPCASVKSGLADAVLLGFLLLALGSGLFMQAFYRWGSSWGPATLTPYVASVAHGRPAVDLIEQMPFLVRLHMVAFFGLVAALPFTRLSLVLMMALHRSTSQLLVRFRFVTSAVRDTQSRMRDRAAAFIWPEETTEPDLAAADGWVPLRSGIAPAPGSALMEANRGDADALYGTSGEAR